MATKKVTKIKKNTFTVNDKEYTAKSVTLNVLCDMQEIGFDIRMLNTNGIFDIFNNYAYYLAVCSGSYDVRLARDEIEEQIKKYNEMDSLQEAADKNFNESGFILALFKMMEKKSVKKAEETEQTTDQTDETADEKTE